ncbi:M23 family metallopeptidase [Kineothrix sp. MB12-C1]|uniref:M23 family metallopeptidase n=1 Tax=Kineothrix sp. MB12-C1 TaxID=3070215 RepID=UPI0027D31333|nr:M23 family metallopeptidase [Kineothrix sp. MB12-C1]WMC94046.1 M23 family metallopeptidase [Kineothrix sp. MB12-C1]
MRRRNRNSARREKTIMLFSSVFVLTALTVTGLFVRGRSEEKNDGYVVDFSAIENETKDLTDGNDVTGAKDIEQNLVTSDDLDYDPYFQETNSNGVENEQEMEEENNTDDKTKKDTEENKDKEKNDKNEEGMFDETIDTARLEQMEDTMAIATSIQPALTFSDGDSLSWPIVGNILINYSMDKTIYFPTLQQYKYNPAIIISAVEGETITAAASGKVISVFSDPEIGDGVVVELGNGYELTYGQLKDITVSEGGYVNKGDIIGSVAAPTKYYIVEGCNVYFKLTKNGIPVNPMTKLS